MTTSSMMSMVYEFQSTILPGDIVRVISDSGTRINDKPFSYHSFKVGDLLWFVSLNITDVKDYDIVVEFNFLNSYKCSQLLYYYEFDLVTVDQDRYDRFLNLKNIIDYVNI